MGMASMPLTKMSTKFLSWLKGSSGYRNCVFWGCLHLSLALIVLNVAESHSIVETLPGFATKLPFKLETGYVGVGNSEELQLFYYFIESQRNPVRDPLLLWLTGGPGCSAFSGLVYEMGPLTFDYEAFNGSFPSFVLNPYSWTQIANIIFLDAPVGTGFSYSTTQEGWNTSDTLSAKAIYEFLGKWLQDHPKFSKNPLYISGDSYSGMIVPMVTYEVAAGNKANQKAVMNLQGYILGNPVTELHNDENSRIQYFHRAALISDELYESAVKNCDGEFMSPDKENAQCMNTIGLMAECTLKVCDAHILEPKCSFASPEPNALKLRQQFFEDDPIDITLSSLHKQRQENWCRNQNYVLSYIWANDEGVQEALHVRNGTVTDWKRCNKSLAYDSNVFSVVFYHKELITSGYRALIYSGDHDMLIPYTGTVTWINKLNFTVVDGWRPWFSGGQIAGFTMKFTKDLGDGLVFATVKGGGHTAPEYRPKECLAMVDRWLSYFGL